VGMIMLSIIKLSLKELFCLVCPGYAKYVLILVLQVSSCYCRSHMAVTCHICTEVGKLWHLDEYGFEVKLAR
jgi:hypothetical protein